MELEKLKEVSGKLMDGKELKGESQRALRAGATVLHLVLNCGRPSKGTIKNPPPSPKNRTCSPQIKRVKNGLALHAFNLCDLELQ